MAIKKRITKISTYEQYLKTCTDKKDMMVFDTEQEAYTYANKLREIIAKDQGVDNWFDCEGVSVDISGLIVRMKILELEPVCI